MNPGDELLTKRESLRYYVSWNSIKKLEELGLSNVRMTEKGEIVSTVTNAIINDDFTKKERKNGHYTSTKEKGESKEERHYTSTKEKGESKEESLLKNISKLRKRLSVL